MPTEAAGVAVMPTEAAGVAVMAVMPTEAVASPANAAHRMGSALHPFAPAQLGQVRDGGSDPTANDQTERILCPWCGCARVVRNGSFRLRSGERVQRYLCRTCERTFSPLSGRPAYRLQKIKEWNASVRLLADDISLRQVASRLSVSVSTAFRWRHRALAYLSGQRRRPLGPRVGVRVVHVKYSEKGSRICNGPGSWGYWNFVRRGPEPAGYVRPRAATGARRRFRLLVDGRPLRVMVAQSEQGMELSILGQGPIAPEVLRDGLSQLVEKDSHVFAFGYELKEACESLGLVCHNGFAAAGGTAAHRSEPGKALPAGVPEPRPVRCPAPPDGWLRRFKGVATRYLAHYLAWFRDIARFASMPDVAAGAQGRALASLLASRGDGPLNEMPV